MTDYVSRDDVLAIINASIADLEYNDENIAVQEAIRAIPAADVREVRTGRWIESKRVPVLNSNWESVYWKCSECGIEICTTFPEYELGKWHYCVNCGADNREEQT